jgi:hypothetical protein
MHLDSTPPQPAGKPCMRDMHELVTKVLPEQLAMLAPLHELERRLREIDATQPRFREETPLYLAGETKRRRRLSGELHVAGRQPALVQASHTQVA